MAGLDKRFASLERSIENCCSGAILSVQVGVAAAHRQPIVLAHRRQNAQLDWQIQVRDHPADHRDLLGVFLPEVGDVWRDDAEELGNDRRHAAEVSWTRRRLEPL